MAISGGINHITLRVKSLERSAEFYGELLGLTKVGARTGMHFYSSGQYNHELALVEDANYKNENSNGLLHIAFNVDSKKALKHLNRKIISAGHPASAGVNHTISRSFYTRDPDSYIIEITTDCDRSEWRHNPQAFENDFILEV